MAIPVVIQKRETYYADQDFPNPVVLTQNTSLTRIARIQCRSGLRPFLTVYAQEMATAGGIDYVTWHLYVNGQPQPPYHSHNNQVASPYGDNRLPVPIRLEQGAVVEIYADLGAAGAGNFNAVGRLIIEYKDLDEDF